MSKSRSYSVVVFAVLALSACAEKFVLSGSPEVGGLLIIDAVVKTKSFMGQDSEPAIVKVTVRKIIGDVFVEGESLQDVFVFQGLKPGKYQLISVATKPGKKEVVLPVPTDDEEAFTFDVAAGKPLYIGQVNIQQDIRLKELGIRYTLAPVPKREIEVWKTLLEQSLRSQWKYVVEKHIASLS
ncbi:MAG: hypothetical protein HY273_13020 [Gammaproteobacteria bacterium]|nr:hypothetical protein [Gammaproteobacteria bacterium]